MGLFLICKLLISKTLADPILVSEMIVIVDTESRFSGCTLSNDLPVSLMLLVTSLSDFLCDITVSQVAERKPSPL